MRWHGTSPFPLFSFSCEIVVVVVVVVYDDNNKLKSTRDGVKLVKSDCFGQTISNGCSGNVAKFDKRAKAKRARSLLCQKYVPLPAMAAERMWCVLREKNHERSSATASSSLAVSIDHTNWTGNSSLKVGENKRIANLPHAIDHVSAKSSRHFRKS